MGRAGASDHHHGGLSLDRIADARSDEVRALREAGERVGAVARGGGARTRGSGGGDEDAALVVHPEQHLAADRGGGGPRGGSEREGGDGRVSARRGDGLGSGVEAGSRGGDRLRAEQHPVEAVVARRVGERGGALPEHANPDAGVIARAGLLRLARKRAEQQEGEVRGGRALAGGDGHRGCQDLLARIAHRGRHRVSAGLRQQVVLVAPQPQVLGEEREQERLATQEQERRSGVLTQEEDCRAQRAQPDQAEPDPHLPRRQHAPVAAAGQHRPADHLAAARDGLPGLALEEPGEGQELQRREHGAVAAERRVLDELRAALANPVGHLRSIPDSSAGRQAPAPAGAQFIRRTSGAGAGNAHVSSHR